MEVKQKIIPWCSSTRNRTIPYSMHMLTFMLKLEVRWQAPYIISLRKGTGQTLLYFSLKEHTSLNGEKTADQTEGIDQSPKL